MDSDRFDALLCDVLVLAAAAVALAANPATPPAAVRPTTTPTTLPITAHIFVPDAVYKVPLAPAIVPWQDPVECGKDPLKWKWPFIAKSDLAIVNTAERAYWQEKDHFDASEFLDFDPAPEARLCLGYIITVGHYTDHPTYASAYFATARHPAGGPMYCVTSLASHTRPAGVPGISQAGGPIQTPEACAALPTLIAVIPNINPWPSSGVSSPPQPH